MRNLKVYRHLDEFYGALNPVLTIGTFDGVHLGHQKILKSVEEAAQEIAGESVLLSFFPHPRMVLEPQDKNIQLLNSLDEKISLLKRSGLQHLILHPFDKGFSEMSAEQFIKDIIIDRIKTHKVVIGYDHHFGHDRSGSLDQLREQGLKHNFEVEEIPAADIKKVSISSTKIRNALLEGNVTLANRFLGYHYFMRGTVVEGDRIGRSMNFPTANIYIEEKHKLIPKNGVYAVHVENRGILMKGMLNIGRRPTLPGKDFSIEVHIFDFNKEIYNETIQVELIERIRDEKKFDDLKSLEEQLNKDKEIALSILK
ncbi:MAG: bifunctional riboflavin kinase/FAD synthetase [Vicingaceae bacterium]